MTDIPASDWNQTDASNTSAAPDGITDNTAPSSVDDVIRAIRGAVKRFWVRINGTITSGGAADAQTLTYSVAPTAYNTGEIYTFKAGFANTGACTLNVNSLGAKSIKKNATAALAAGDIAANQLVMVSYDGTNFQLMNPPATQIADPTTTRGDIITRGASAIQRLALGAVGKVLRSDGTDAVWGNALDAAIIPVTGETTVVTSGTGKRSFPWPFATTLTAVSADLVTAQTSGSTLTIDINEGGTTILSTKLTIDNGETSSSTAATPAVISDAAIAAGAIITIDVDAVGDGTAKGLTVTMKGYQT